MNVPYILITALFFIITVFTYTEQRVATSFNTRSISRNAARDLSGWKNYINKDNSYDKVYGVFSVTPQYNHTFSSNAITHTLFGDNLITLCKNSPALVISGSQVNNRSPQDLLADYFYLPSDFKSTVQFEPVIDNIIIDFGFYLGLDAWKKGVYFWLHAPFAHTRWNTNMHENIISSGVNNAAPGYYTPGTLARNQLLKDFTDFINGNLVKNTENISFEELKFGKISSERLIKSRMAEIRTGFGWNFFTEETYHSGINIQLATPTGLRPDAEYLFEPLVGNGHFWELGFGANGHYTFWQNQNKTTYCSFYVDINITHLFKTRQARSFDLIRGGTLSRYMLATEMISPAVNLQGANQLVPLGQFDNNFLPVANITTLDIDISIAIQADIVFMFNIAKNNWCFDLGYNYWGRSSDSITLRQNESFDEKRFSIKGDAHVFGFIPNSITAVSLSATQDNATIHTGKNFPSTGSTDPAVITTALKNPSIDFPQTAQTNPTPPIITQNLLYAPNLANDPSNFINTSVPPLFITRNDLDFKGAQTSGSSNKIFTHFSYTWNDKVEWQPYLGVGGEVEWTSHTKKDRKPCQKHLPQCSTSQWGIWLKTGATFN